MPLLSRADVADAMLRQLSDPTYVRKVVRVMHGAIEATHPAFVAAIKATGRRKLVIAGCTIDIILQQASGPPRGRPPGPAIPPPPTIGFAWIAKARSEPRRLPAALSPHRPAPASGRSLPPPLGP
jgi:hypothetical protein